MRHRQAAAARSRSSHVDHAAAARRGGRASRRRRRSRPRGDIGRLAVAHGQAIQMAAVLGGETRQKGGRHSGMKLWVARPRKAGEQGIDEDRLPSAAKATSCTSRSPVKVAVCGTNGVVAALDLLAIHRVDECRDLHDRGDGQAAAVEGHAHRALEAALEYRQSAGFLVGAEQDHLAALVGRDRQAGSGRRKPAHEVSRRGESEATSGFFSASSLLPVTLIAPPGLFRRRYTGRGQNSLLSESRLLGGYRLGVGGREWESNPLRAVWRPSLALKASRPTGSASPPRSTLAEFSHR